MGAFNGAGTIEQFKQNLTGQGARPTLFDCSILFANAMPSTALQNFKFTCKTASIPGRAIGTIELPYFGRKLKVAGDATWEPWTVTVINDESFASRDMFGLWMENINGAETNVRSDYKYLMATGQVTQYAKDGSTLKLYTMDECWPSDLAAIELAWDQNDNWEEYQVTFQYQFWNDSNNFGGTLSTVPQDF